MRDRKERQAAIQQERGRLRQQQEQHANLEQQLQREQAAILKAIPEWEKDGAKSTPTIRPGPSEPKSKAKVTKAQKAQRRLEQSGKLYDAQAAIEAIL